MKFKKDRPVGEECRKWYNDWVDNGMLEKYLSGKVIDCGFSGYIEGVVPITDDAIGIDLDTPDYDGVKLPFKNNSIDGILSSHILEHVPTKDVTKVLREWYRVLKVGKFAVITVPHQYLYEKKTENEIGQIPGSHYNGDHQRFYTPARLLAEIEEALAPNSYRIELLKDNDKDYTYDIGPGKHCGGSCEIMLVLKKIKKPDWNLMPGLSEKLKSYTITGPDGNPRVITEKTK